MVAICGTGEFGDIVAGAFTPVLAKHSKSFSLIDRISVGVDRMQRNFEPMRKQVEAWQRSVLTDVTCTSSRNTRNSGRGPSGVSPMRSCRRLRNWIQSRSSGPRPS
jgi:hypothetical protein